MEDTDLFNHVDNEGRTVLHLAMAGNDDKIIKFLLNIKDLVATKQVGPRLSLHTRVCLLGLSTHTHMYT